MVEVFVNQELPNTDVEPPKKEKKKRAPMSEERKAVLREQLAKAREVKKAARLAKKAEKEAAKDKPAVAPVAPVAEAPVEPVKVAPTSDYKSEIAELRAELAAFKKSQPWEYNNDEVNALKAELKDIRDAAKAYKSAKSKKDKEDKALAKKLKENHVASPAPQKPPPSLPIAIPEAPRYSTYRKSIWNKFK